MAAKAQTSTTNTCPSKTQDDVNDNECYVKDIKDTNDIKCKPNPQQQQRLPQEDLGQTTTMTTTGR